MRIRLVSLPCVLPVLASCVAPPPEPARGPQPALLPQTCPKGPPDYLAEALRKNQTGTVNVVASVDATGALVALRVMKSSGYEALDNATLRLFARCRYQPAYDGDRPVAGEVVLRYTWNLQ